MVIKIPDSSKKCGAPESRSNLWTVTRGNQTVKWTSWCRNGYKLTYNQIVCRQNRHKRASSQEIVKHPALYFFFRETVQRLRPINQLTVSFVRDELLACTFHDDAGSRFWHGQWLGSAHLWRSSSVSRTTRKFCDSMRSLVTGVTSICNRRLAIYGLESVWYRPRALLNIQKVPASP